MLQRKTVWQLHHRKQPVTDCEAWKENDIVCVVVTRAGGADVAHTPAEASAIIRAPGWRTVVRGCRLRSWFSERAAERRAEHFPPVTKRAARIGPRMKPIAPKNLSPRGRLPGFLDYEGSDRTESLVRTPTTRFMYPRRRQRLVRGYAASTHALGGTTINGLAPAKTSPRNHRCSIPEHWCELPFRTPAIRRRVVQWHNFARSSYGRARRGKFGGHRLTR